MNTSPELQRKLVEHVDAHADRLLDITRKLIRTPSENTPPHGAEEQCQQWLAEQIADWGLKPDLYRLSDVLSLQSHPLYFQGRDYTSRPNLATRRKGSGSGRSLVLSGHIDTVPRGTQDWTRDPFSGQIEGNRLYGRGSNDMKAGVAANLFVLESLDMLKLSLKGHLIFESIVDEEFGGCNGTLAGRLRGYNADAALISEPSSLRICPAQRGGRTAHIRFQSAAAGVLDSGRFPSGVIPQVTCFLNQLPSFARERKAGVQVHEMYVGSTDPVPVAVTKIFTSPWGYAEPITVPDTAHLELYWQLMPGETQQDVEAEFFGWLNHLVEQNAEIFPAPPLVEFPLRWLPGSAIPASEQIVQQLSACAEAILHSAPAICGIEGPCDLFVFHQFGIPAALWGPRGGKAHSADEYVEIDSLISAAKVLLLFAVEWCALA